MKNSIILACLLLPLLACTLLETGVFLDSPVINIGYKTETQSGVTNLLGEYNYLPDETVTFFIGDLELPSVLATGIVTPLDLAGTRDTSNSTVINIIRLLQTLDKDGVPSNGIEITETAVSSATQVNFNLDEATFESSSAVTNLIFNGGQDLVVTSLISTAEAILNFEAQLIESNIPFGTIVGVWDNSFATVTFFDDGTYIYLSNDSEEGGVEQGTYALNTTTNLLSTTQTLDENGGRGFSENIDHFASVSGNTLTLSFDDNSNGVIDEGESVEFSKQI